MKYFSEVENLFDKKIKEQPKDASDDVIGLMVNIIWPLRLPPIKAYRRSCVEIFLKKFNKEVLINSSSNSLLENFDVFAKSRQKYYDQQAKLIAFYSTKPVDSISR